MKKIIVLSGIIVVGLGLYIGSTYQLDQGPACTQGSPRVDCIEGHECSGFVSEGKCITNFNDCDLLKDDKVICELTLAQ